DLPPDAGASAALERLTVPPEVAGGRLNETKQQRHEARLACSRRSDQGQSLSRMKAKGNAAQSLAAVSVAKSQVAEIEALPQRAQLAAHIGLRLGVEYFEEAVGRGSTLGHLRERARERLGRLVHQRGGGEKREQLGRQFGFVGNGLGADRHTD